MVTFLIGGGPVLMTMSDRTPEYSSKLPTVTTKHSRRTIISSSRNKSDMVSQGGTIAADTAKSGAKRPPSGHSRTDAVVLMGQIIRHKNRDYSQVSAELLLLF